MSENQIHAVDQVPPVVHARLSRFGQLVVRCPFCGQEHYHGKQGGAGHRSSDCAPETPGSSRGYILKIAGVEAEGVQDG